MYTFYKKVFWSVMKKNTEKVTLALPYSDMIFSAPCFQKPFGVKVSIIDLHFLPHQDFIAVWADQLTTCLSAWPWPALVCERERQSI